MEGNGLPQETQGFKGSTDKRIELVRKQLEETIGNEVSDLEQAILDATDLLTAELGGYVVKRQNELLIMDTPDVETAQKVWRWNLNGLGYSSTGVNGTYGTAITMDGGIVANYINTGTLSANRVRTGSITSVAGNSYFDLDNGIVRVSHGGTQYSEMNVNGFKRQWEYGQAEYLNGIYVVTNLSGGADRTSPVPVTVTLPTSFRNRGSDVQIILNLRQLDMGVWIAGWSSGWIRWIPNYFKIVLEVASTNFSLTNPTITINAYMEITRDEFADSGGGRTVNDYVYYRDLDFDVLVIGK
jgi:hypothetical protein